MRRAQRPVGLKILPGPKYLMPELSDKHKHNVKFVIQTEAPLAFAWGVRIQDLVDWAFGLVRVSPLLAFGHILGNKPESFLPSHELSGAPDSSHTWWIGSHRIVPGFESPPSGLYSPTGTTAATLLLSDGSSDISASFGVLLARNFGVRAFRQSLSLVRTLPSRGFPRG